MNLYEKLSKIQMELKVSKNQYNNFGGYKYRSCEDILEALKPLLEKQKVVLKMNDDVEVYGERYYIKATAVLKDLESEEYFYNTAYAREEETKKGMDGSQITGASSSYARKYALNGMFLIDDVKDSDNTNKEEKPKITEAQITQIKELVPEDKFENMLNYYKIKKLEEMSYDDAESLIERKKLDK